MTEKEIKTTFYKAKVADRIITMLAKQDDETIRKLLENLILYIRSETTSGRNSLIVDMLLWLIIDASDKTVDEVFASVYALNEDELD